VYKSFRMKSNLFQLSYLTSSKRVQKFPWNLSFKSSTKISKLLEWNSNCKCT
jgi:hypothetical protein